MADLELSAKITTVADNSGSDQAVAGLDKVGEKAAWTAEQIKGVDDKLSSDPLEAYAQSAKKLADSLDDDAEGFIAFAKSTSAVTVPLKEVAPAATSASVSTEKLGQIFGGLARAGSGGRESLIGLAAAARGLFSLLGGGTVGLMLGLVAALAGLAVSFSSTGKSAEEAKKKIDELNKAKLDAAVKEQEALKRAAEDTLRTLQAEAAAREQIADAELGKRKAETIAKAKVAGEDPIVTQQKLTALDRQRDDEKRKAAIGLANEEANAKAEAQKAAEAEAIKAELAVDDVAKRAAKVRAAEEATDEARNLMLAQNGQNGSAGDYASAKARLREAQKAAKGDTPEGIAGLQGNAEKTKATAEAAARATEQARTDAKRLADTQAVIAPKIADTWKAEDAAKRDKTPSEEAAQKKAQEAEDARIRRTSPAIWNNRMAMKGGVDDATAAAVQRNYPGYKFVDRPKSDAPAAPMTPTGTVAELAAKTAAEAAARAAAAKPSGGTITDANGQVINTAARQPTGPSMIGLDGRPVAVQSAQPTGPGRGAYREGQDGAGGAKKAGDEIATAMGDAKKSTEATGEGMDAAAKATKDFAEAQTAANEQISTTFSAQAEVMSTLTFGVSELADAVTRAIERIKRLEAQAKEAAAKARAAKVQ